jgi:type I restriction enzyme S subunit
MIRHTIKSVPESALSDYPALRLYPPGTILVAMYGATIGRLGILDISAVTNQACCALYKPKGVEPRYVYYCLLTARQELRLLGAGGGQPNISQATIRSFVIPWPKLDEQRRIVAFVDNETAKIRALMDKTRELISTMKERRAALITAAVTGQLDVSTYGKGA